MRDDLKDASVSKVSEDKVVLPDDIVEGLKLHPDDYIEIFSYSGIGQMEFCGISYIDDDNGIYIPDEILEKLEKRDTAKFTLGKDMVIVRIEASGDDEQEISSRLRQAIKGTLTTKKPPVEMRLYKHICDVIRYGASHDYVPLGNTCALCGETLKGRENVITYKTMKPLCVRCGKEVAGNFCGNCGLKLRRREKGRKCSNCGNKLDYLEKWGRFYCAFCGKYERAVKPGVKNATCPDCGKQLSYVKKHDSFFCFECDGYRRPLELTPDAEKGKCPDCGGNLTYAKKYRMFYCRKCQGYKEPTGSPADGTGDSDTEGDTADESGDGDEEPKRPEKVKSSKPASGKSSKKIGGK
jgi:predicted RNA-binding Zn-ribbon protein involved in translation (DUF1610 family)